MSGYGYGYGYGSFSDDGVAFETAGHDYNGDAMCGLPLSSTVQKFSFCCAPDDYVVHAVDTAGDGWWGGAYYSVIVDGVTVVREEMGSLSSSVQSTMFSVALPSSTRTAFSKNRAPHGGGGALFWEDVPPAEMESYRDYDEENVALYGDYAATPARALSATRAYYNATSGASMVADPITVQFTDR